MWTGLGAELREPVAFLLVHDRPIERALFLAATEARPTALDAAIEMGLVRALRGWLWVPDEWRSLSPRIEQRDRLRRRLAEGLERVALSDPAPEAVLEAHRHLAALGESRRAARFAEFGVLLLLDLARGQSIGRHYPSAARTYEAVLEFDERIRAAADPEGVGPHPRAYAIHYRAYNRYKAGSHGSVLETLAAYREALGLWPEHALFWSRTISCCFVAGRYEEALRARAQAFASVPPHPNRSTLLIQRTVEHLLERGLVLPALLVWDNHRPETIPQRHVGERLFETAAAGWQCEEIWAPTTGSLRFAPAVEVHVRRDGDRFQCMLFDLEPPDAPRPSEAVANAIRAVRDTAIAALEQERDVAWLAVLDSERPAGSDEDAAWLAALLRLRARRLDWRMPEVQHRAVLEILRRMREAAPSIRRPLLGPTEEGAYQLVWSYRDRSAALEIEVGVDGSVQWLFIDRDKGSCEGSDEPEPHLPERAVSFAQRIA
ncbi:MAG: hypothetical protein M5U28_23235 [Sandaracinaceae bacterium]|nr:hypothetical protein [Sandaracinaceae bacterium]